LYFYTICQTLGFTTNLTYNSSNWKLVNQKSNAKSYEMQTWLMITSSEIPNVWGEKGQRDKKPSRDQSKRKEREEEEKKLSQDWWAEN